jgi:zinc transport system substrate-binding protein
MRRTAAALAALIIGGLVGCSDDSGTAAAADGSRTTRSGPAAATAAADKVTVAAAFYPLEFLTERVGGELVEVTGLTQPGAEPHDLELTAKQVAGLGETDLVVFERGFQPAVDEAVDEHAKDRSLDLAAVQPLEQGFVPLEEGELHEDEKGADPHIWLDPQRMQSLADATAKRLAQVRPGAAQSFEANAAALKADLAALDEEFRAGLSGCARREFVTSHNAFGYLARRYGLEQIAITGLTPESEPSPKRLIEVAELAKARKVTTIFFEELVSPKTAESLAREVGAEAQVLSPLEAAPESGDYFSGMRTNLASLHAALGCP